MKQVFILFNFLFVLSLPSIFCADSLLLKYYNLFKKGHNLPDISYKEGEWFINGAECGIDDENGSASRVVVDEENYFIEISYGGPDSSTGYQFALYLTSNKNIIFIGISSFHYGINPVGEYHTFDFYKKDDSGIYNVTDDIVPANLLFKDMDWNAVYHSFDEVYDKFICFNRYYDIICDIPEFGTVTKINIIKKFDWEHLDNDFRNMDYNEVQIMTIKNAIKKIESSIIRQSILLEWNYRKGAFEIVKNK